ncbi:hypothetical protein GGP41_007001 [Bipolaris sorokiniana]|uniref:Uncharacterized protein n=2 Tax=Cochliobolus sativus TaxID=45130 RepID=A0A8H5ZUR7_COCSA|nr:uncharacterized protein COCSADRAFT_33950 [Bipolaris sorokiniana ND90Pr]EMD67067.1 hypothetical protein COCSADRAFT_33950 [Bipolaris sorokiniana ND90Pr]KAF5854278.1 hypothetical protein GGP41_007001 [Bipolaris sorokiniana]
MPPKSQNAHDTNRKDAAAAVETPVATPRKKRGRPTKSQTSASQSNLIASEPPKKRGRLSKVTAEVDAVLPDASEPIKRGRGRKPDASKSAALAATSNKAKGKGTKDDVEAVTDIAEPTPRRRGRPPKAEGLALKRVAGTARVSKRQAAQSKTTKSTTTASKLRTRLPPASKVSKGEPAPPPARRGRPPKNAAQAPAATALAKKKKIPRGRKAAELPVAKPTKPTKPLASRKMRGHTVRQIPDRYIVQVDQLLHDLMQADADPMFEKQVQEEEANQAHDMEVEADVEDNVDEENMVPTSATIGDQGPEDAPLDAGAESESGHQQDSQGDQYSDGVADDLRQSESTSDQSREQEQEQDLQSELNGDFDDPPSHEDEDGILVPQQEIDMPDEEYANGAEGGQLL